jgi:hypothetical protein
VRAERNTGFVELFAIIAILIPLAAGGAPAGVDSPQAATREATAIAQTTVTYLCILMETSGDHAAILRALATFRVNGAAGLQTGRVRADLKVGPSIA